MSMNSIPLCIVIFSKYISGNIFLAVTRLGTVDPKRNTFRYKWIHRLGTPYL
jgi:hypothetical protein